MRKEKAVAISALILIFNGCFSFTTGLDYDDEDQRDTFHRCPWIRNKLKNGRVKVRSRGRIAKFSCKPGFDLVGKRFATCVRGQWNNPIPVCVMPGCRRVSALNNGKVIERYRGAQMSFDCNPGYSMLGESTISCDGKNWDKEPPICQTTTLQPKMSCDFEDRDLCGWSHDPEHDFDWKRNLLGTPSGHVGTGPSFDHTHGKGKAGFYMYIEASAPRAENDTSRIFSPVYSRHYTPGCFVFWYHMYGATTGGLRVYFKPESQVLAELDPAWQKYGEQGNQWRRGNIAIPELSENFQIVIEGVRGSSYVGDTAIDDVSLSHTNCSFLDSSNSTDTAEVSEDSCRGRCHEVWNSTSCGCTDACETNETCCSDYSKICAENGEVPNGEEEPKENLTTTGNQETEAAAESSAPENIGTAYSITPLVLSTELETPTSREQSPMQPVVTQYTSVGTTSSLSTKTVSQTTQKPEPPTSIASEVLTTRTLLSTIAGVLVYSDAPRPVNVTTQSSSEGTTTKEPTTGLKVLTVTSKEPTSTTKASTAITFIAQFVPSSTTATTTMAPPTVVETRTTPQPIVSTESTTPYFASLTSLAATTKLSSKVPIQSTVLPTSTSNLLTTSSMTQMATSTAISSSIPTTMTTSTISSANVSVGTSITIPTAMITSTTVSTASDKSTLTSTKFPVMPITSPKTYSTASSAQSTTTNWKTSPSFKTIPTTPSTTLSTIVFRVTTQKVTSPPRQTAFTKMSSIKTTGTKKANTNPVSLFYTTESQTMPDKAENADTHASKTTADASQNHSPSVVGICVGILLLACCIGGIAYVFLRRRREKQNKLRDDSEMRFLPDNEVIEYSDGSVLDQLEQS